MYVIILIIDLYLPDISVFYVSTIKRHLNNVFLKFFKCCGIIFLDRFCKCEDYNEDSEDIKVKYHLVLRQWQDLNPASEFRCYVRNNQLVGKYL
jgi:hypothetical protein